MRYECKPIATNHCSGPSDLTLLQCVRCGGESNQHLDLGAWQPGEPMVVTTEGKRLKSIPITG